MKKWPWFLLSVLVIAADQLSKLLAVKWLLPYHASAVAPFFNFTLAFNTGAAFSFLSGAGNWHTWFFMGFSFVVSLTLFFWIMRLPQKARLQPLALSLILGGAIGNLIDRIHYGYVIDFIDIYYKNYHWPIFNIADSAISIGACLLMVDLLVNREK